MRLRSKGIEAYNFGLLELESFDNLFKMDRLYQIVRLWKGKTRQSQRDRTSSFWFCCFPLIILYFLIKAFWDGPWNPRSGTVDGNLTIFSNTTHPLSHLTAKTFDGSVFFWNLSSRGKRNLRSRTHPTRFRRVWTMSSMLLRIFRDSLSITFPLNYMVNNCI